MPQRAFGALEIRNTSATKHGNSHVFWVQSFLLWGREDVFQRSSAAVRSAGRAGGTPLFRSAELGGAHVQDPRIRADLDKEIQAAEETVQAALKHLFVFGRCPRRCLGTTFTLRETWRARIFRRGTLDPVR